MSALRPELLGEVLFALRAMRHKTRKDLAAAIERGRGAELQAALAGRLDRIQETMAALKLGDSDQMRANDMGVVMKIVGTGVELFERPVYLKAFDVEAFDGRGSATYTVDIAEAMVFEDAAALFAAWRTQSKVRPLREHDGQPNRPLTMFTIETEKAPEARAVGLATVQGKANGDRQ